MVTSFSSAGLVSIVWGIWSLVEDDEKENPSPLCTLRRTHGNRSVEGCLPGNLGWNFGTSFWPRFRPRFGTAWKPWKLQIIIKRRSKATLCAYARKNQQPESRVSWGSQTNNRVEAVAPHKHSHHRSTNHSPIFWVPRFIDVPYLVPILILFLAKKCVQP